MKLFDKATSEESIRAACAWLGSHAKYLTSMSLSGTIVTIIYEIKQSFARVHSHVKVDRVTVETKGRCLGLL